MPNGTTPKATKLHPGRDAGQGASQSSPRQQAPSQSLDITSPSSDTQPTAFEGQAHKNAAESALAAILALGSARDDIKDGLKLPNDIYHDPQRERAVQAIETIMADLVGGLNRAVQEGGVDVVIQGEGYKLPHRPSLAESFLGRPKTA